MLAGERDPLVDRSFIANLAVVPGAHACTYSHPEETAGKVLVVEGLSVKRDVSS